MFLTGSAKILVVEDDPSIVRLLEVILKAYNFEVYSTSLGGQVPALIKEVDPSLFILDIDLPDANGIELISIIRQHTQAPIMMLSGKNTDIEKISSFNFGADDYVVKPFSVGELVARVQVILRRFQITTSMQLHSDQTASTDDTIFIDIDPEQRRVFIGSKEVLLTNKEFQLLQLLHQRKGKVLSRELILDNIWGINNFDIETRAVDACVSRLRKKIKANFGQDIIEAVPGTGYRLLPQSQLRDSAAAN